MLVGTELTKLCNTDEQAPDEYFVFVDPNNFMARNNLLAGAFTSAAFLTCTIDQTFMEKYLKGKVRYLPFEPTSCDVMAVSPFMSSTISGYKTEYDFEVVREKQFPLFPSRLSATYAFGSWEDCLLANKHHGWHLSEVRRFRLRETPLNRVAKVDMEIVTVARGAGSPVPDHVCSMYWAGQPGFLGGRAPLWEYLVEGMLELIDEPLPTA